MPPKKTHRDHFLCVVVAELHDVRRARGIVIGNQDRVAIRMAFHCGVHADGASGASPVFHYYLLPDCQRHALARCARDKIDSAPWRQWNDESYRLVRPIRCLRPCSGAVAEASSNSTGGGKKKCAAIQF